MEIQITNATIVGLHAEGTNVTFTVSGNPLVHIDGIQVTGTINGAPAWQANAGALSGHEPPPPPPPVEDDDAPPPNTYSETLEFVAGSVMTVQYPQGNQKTVWVAPVVADENIPISYLLAGMKRGGKNGIMTVNLFAFGGKESAVTACVATEAGVFEGPAVVHQAITGSDVTLQVAVGNKDVTGMPNFNPDGGQPLFINVIYRNASKNQALQIAAHDR